MAENNEGLPPEIEKLSERLAKDPKSLAFSSLANAYRKNSMVDEAIEILQKGLDIHPNYASARTVLGKCYVDKRMYELAKEEFRKALENDPQNIVVLENLGQIYKTLNQPEEAYSIYKNLLELDPLNPDFEREIESLKNLVGEISPKQDQFSAFQTIPDGNHKKEPEPDEDTTEKTKFPGLSEIFEPAEQTSEKKSDDNSEGKILTTSTQFSEMFDSDQLDTEKPTTTEEEPESVPEKKPVEKAQKDEGPQIVMDPERITESTEKIAEPIVTQPPTEEKPIETKPSEEKETEEKPIETKPPEEKETEETPVETKPHEEKETEETPIETKPPEESERMDGITSIFEESEYETKQEKLEQKAATEDEKIMSELSKGLEKPEKVVAPQEKPQEITAELKKTEAKEKPTATATLAEIYLSQGFTDEALNIYKELLGKDPENDALKKKIKELEEQKRETPQSKPPEEGTSSEKNSGESRKDENAQDSENLDNFQDWLKKFQK